MSSSNSPHGGEKQDNQMDPPSTVNSIYETVEIAQPGSPLPDCDGVFVESLPLVDGSPRPLTDAVLVYGDVQEGDPNQSVICDVKNGGDSSLIWPEAVDPQECRPLNSSRVLAVQPEAWVPANSADDSWVYEDLLQDVIYESDSKAVPSIIGAGLANLGNTCFLNSIMQCFTHTVPLLESILDCSHTYDDRHYGFCVICAFRYQMTHSLQSTGRVVSPYILVDNLHYFNKSFRRYQQEDVHEFMSCALDELDSCFLNLKRNNPNFEDKNIVQKVFGGSLASKLRCCNCGHSSDTSDPIIDLSLQLENVDALSSALESFTMVENMDGKFKCEGCNEEVSKEKRLMLGETPTIAAFHLKRFKTDGILVEKIDKHIKFPLELDLQPYTILNGNNDVSLKYDLYAVVVHTGFSSTSGHYFCFIRTAPDTWHKFDDSKVTKVSEETVLSQEAYMLFYARQGTPWFSKFVESRIPVLERCNTSPKSVLDVTDGQDKSCPTLNGNIERSGVGESKELTDGQNKSFPTLNGNIERSGAGESKEFPKKFDYSGRQSREFLETDDIIYASPCREQFPAGPSNQKTPNLSGSEDINAQVQPLNRTSLTNIAKPGGSSHAENGAPDKNKCSQDVFDFIENDGFNPLTPPNSPPYQTPPGKSFQISRDHLKTENQGSCKRSSSSSSNKSNKSADSAETKAAITYLKKMRGLSSRRCALMEYLDASPSNSKGSSENKRKKTDSSQSDKGNNSARKKSSHASVTAYPVAAGISQ
ncbi:hypothetical protein TSUD_221960 [Trifolium subterraneum]|nr:hypothetical protein TSUD_221960 [Trifolium subterraneum]